MKKILFYLVFYVNISYASFPITGAELILNDTILPDTNKLVVKETKEEYHIRMRKLGIDISSSCPCELCLNLQPLSPEIRRESNRRLIINLLLVVLGLLLILLIIFINGMRNASFSFGDIKDSNGNSINLNDLFDP